MGITIVDRRFNDKGESNSNKDKFLKRVKGQIKNSIPTVVGSNSIKDIAKGKGGISIPIKNVKEPEFTYEPGTGTKRYVHSGNPGFVEGDKIQKPDGGGSGRSRKGSKDGPTSEDDFVISISRDEFLKYFFDDLRLPDMVLKQLQQEVEWVTKRTGITSAGSPSRLNILRSLKNSMGRRLAVAEAFRKKAELLQEEADAEKGPAKKRELEEEAEKMRKLATSVGMFEEIDLRYNNVERKPVPTVSAVMFCIMDVSGSMGEKEKDIAKRFFTLLYIFLTKEYERIDLVFIRHHTEAAEVTEDEFFNSLESGGTCVRPALELMRSIMNERYSSGWNIYCCQASDGDVWGKEDAEECAEILGVHILPKIRYMAYIEIMRDAKGALWEEYKGLAKYFKNMSMRQIITLADIWPVFRQLFEEKKPA